MTGQIPKYGAAFRRERTSYSQALASTLYVLKANADWAIRADKTSKRWFVFAHGIAVGGPFPTMSDAMTATVAATTALKAS